MAIGRGSMTKELIGNRVKMDTTGGIVQASKPITAVPPMKKGGKVRGNGCAVRGTKGGKMV
jgi:hypothetical protein